jgi:hypothetical protein
MKGRSEHATQNDIRNSLCDVGLFFRANVGQGWTGKAMKRADGSVLLLEARPFSTGLPTGFADVFGLVPTVITPDMVGQTVAVFAAIECKSSTGRGSDAQKRFIAAVQQAGGRAGFARDVDTALSIAKGK